MAGALSARSTPALLPRLTRWRTVLCAALPYRTIYLYRLLPLPYLASYAAPRTRHARAHSFLRAYYHTRGVGNAARAPSRARRTPPLYSFSSAIIIVGHFRLSRAAPPHSPLPATRYCYLFRQRSYPAPAAAADNNTGATYFACRWAFPLRRGRRAALQRLRAYHRQNKATNTNTNALAAIISCLQVTYRAPHLRRMRTSRCYHDTDRAPRKTAAALTVTPPPRAVYPPVLARIEHALAAWRTRCRATGSHRTPVRRIIAVKHGMRGTRRYRNKQSPAYRSRYELSLPFRGARFYHRASRMVHHARIGGCWLPLQRNTRLDHGTALLSVLSSSCLPIATSRRRRLLCAFQTGLAQYCKL